MKISRALIKPLHSYHHQEPSRCKFDFDLSSHFFLSCEEGKGFMNAMGSQSMHGNWITGELMCVWETEILYESHLHDDDDGV